MLVSRFHSGAILGCSFLAVAWASTGAHAANLLLNNTTFDNGQYPYQDNYNSTLQVLQPLPASSISGWTATAVNTDNYAYYGQGYDDLAGSRSYLDAQFGYLSNVALQTAAGSRAVVAAGTTYDLTFLLRNGNNSSNPTQAGSATISIIFYDGNTAGANILGTFSETLPILPNGAGTAAVTPYAPGVLEALAPAGATYASAQVINTSGTGVAIDTFDLEVAVPEPASLSIAAIGFLGALGRRRKA